MSTPEFPVVDASVQDAISDDQRRFFLEQGLLLIRNVLSPPELAALRAETAPLVARAVAAADEPDYAYKEHAATGRPIPYRLEYVVDKSPACRALLAHPFVLRSIELLQGPDFIPTWDSMVFKLGGEGAAIPWHRDAGLDHVLDERPILNVGFYLDRSDLSNCLWGIPGSNHWSEEAARAGRGAVARRFRHRGRGSAADGAGRRDLHNILVLHGSPAARSQLRRVLYYEFRAVDSELAIGPHTAEYVPLKQHVLHACIRHRAATPYAAGERRFAYRAPATDAEPSSYRVPHHEFWRESHRERWAS